MYELRKRRCTNRSNSSEASSSSSDADRRHLNNVRTEAVDDPEVVSLPPFRFLAPPNFLWGSLSVQSGVESVDQINNCYSRAVHWIPNLIKLPSGKLFVKELSRLFRQYVEGSAMQCIALRAAFLLPLLVLQKPHCRSKVKVGSPHEKSKLL